MTREEINNVCLIVHSTILEFFGDNERLSEEERLLLKVRNAIIAKIEKLGGDEK